MDIVKRGGAAFVDILLVSVVFVPIVTSTENNSQVLHDILQLIPFGLILNKDVLYGKSAGKRFFGYVVTSRDSGKPASPLKCLIRNITIFIYPIEVVIMFFNPANMRIGDYLAGTKVERCPPSGLALAWNELKNVRFKFHSLFCILITVIVLALIGSFLGIDTFSF